MRYATTAIATLAALVLTSTATPNAPPPPQPWIISKDSAGTAYVESIPHQDAQALAAAIATFGDTLHVFHDTHPGDYHLNAYAGHISQIGTPGPGQVVRGSVYFTQEP